MAAGERWLSSRGMATRPFRICTGSAFHVQDVYWVGTWRSDPVLVSSSDMKALCFEQGTAAPAGGVGVAMAASELVLAVQFFSSTDKKAFSSVFSGSDTKAFASVLERDTGRGFSVVVTRKLSCH